MQKARKLRNKPANMGFRPSAFVFPQSFGKNSLDACGFRQIQGENIFHINVPGPKPPEL